jgi:hypothetical protein
MIGLQPADGVKFACAYTVDVMPFEFLEVAFFRRNGQVDELFLKQIIGTVTEGRRAIAEINRIVKSGIAGFDNHLAATTSDLELSACLRLIGKHIRSGLGCQWPGRFLKAGLIDEDAFRKLRSGIEKELEENANSARQEETEIIRVARECALQPEPTGTSQNTWRARCPGTNHPMYLSTETNSFGCGWCKRKGSARELRQFVDERRNKKTSLPVTRNGVPIFSDGRYWLKGHWPAILKTLLEFPDRTAPSVRDLAIKVGDGRIHWGIVHRWNTIPEALVSRIRCGSRIQLKLTDLGFQVIGNPSCFGS